MMKIEIKQWALSDAKELTSLCNAVDRRFLSDRLPNPYTEGSWGSVLLIIFYVENLDVESWGVKNDV